MELTCIVKTDIASSWWHVSISLSEQYLSVIQIVFWNWNESVNIHIVLKIAWKSAASSHQSAPQTRMVSFPFIPSAAKSVTDGRVHPNALLDVQIDRWWNVTLLSSTASLYNASVGVDKLVEVTSCFFFAPLSKLVKVVHAQKSNG